MRTGLHQLLGRLQGVRQVLSVHLGLTPQIGCLVTQAVGYDLLRVGVHLLQQVVVNLLELEQAFQVVLLGFEANLS